MVDPQIIECPSLQMRERWAVSESSESAEYVQIQVVI